MNTSICHCDVPKIVTKMFLMGTLKNCIQNLPSLSFYNQTRTLKKGTKTLSTYRCARGSTSLESFHLHLNRFIPSEITVCGSILILLTGTDSELHVIGTSANDVHYQAFLLEGLYRWRLHCSTLTVDFCDFCEPAVTDCPGEPSRPGIPAPQSLHRRVDWGGVFVLPDRQGPPSHTIGGGPITKKRTRTTTRDSRKKTQKSIPPFRM